MNLTIKKYDQILNSNNNTNITHSDDNNIEDYEVYGILNTTAPTATNTNSILKRRSSGIYRALSKSPVDRAIEYAAKSEQSNDMKYGEIERKVEMDLLNLNMLNNKQKENSRFNNNTSSVVSNKNVEPTYYSNVERINNLNNELRAKARKEEQARIDTFTRVENNRNNVVNKAQALLNQLHQEDLHAQRMKEQKIKEENDRKERQRQQIIAKRKEEERIALETKRKNDAAIQKKKEIEMEKARKENAAANAVNAKRKDHLTDFKQMAEEYDKRAAQADAAKDDPSLKTIAKTIRRAINKINFTNNKENIQKSVQLFLNVQNTANNNAILKDYSRVYLIRKILDENHEPTGEKMKRPAIHETIFHRGQLILEISLADKAFCNMFLGAISSIREFEMQEKSLKRFPWLFRDDLPIYDVDGVYKRLLSEGEDKYTKCTDRIFIIVAIYAAFVQSVPANNDAGLHPHGIPNAWVFISRILNLDSSRLFSYHSFGIYNMLLICSHQLFRNYRNQFIKLAKLARTDFLKHIEENVKDAWHQQKDIASLKLFMVEVKAFIDEAILDSSPPNTSHAINQKNIYLHFSHSNVRLQNLNNPQDRKWSAGSLPIGHYQRLPDRA